MSEIKVNSIKGVAASSAAITVNNTDGTCTANITNNLSNRNLVINGAMQVAQRGTSSTVDGYGSVDRFLTTYGGTDEAPTQAQVDVASGTTPYTLGFRKALRITNGNQTSGAGAGDSIIVRYKVEDQDLANSGWNYLSSSSNITFSFWVKSSVAQNFYFDLQTHNGSVYNYVMETGSLSADTWTKVTKTITGNSNIILNNDNGIGLFLTWRMFNGTNETGTRPLNAWAARDATSQTPDQTSTWYTTNDATFEITGVQLEVGSTATDFEHRSFGQELQLCSRYYQQWAGVTSGSSNDNPVAVMANFSATHAYGRIPYLNGPMRTAPSITQSNNSYFTNGASFTGLTYTISGASTTAMEANVSASSGNWTAGHAGWLRVNSGSGGQFALDAEL